MKGKKTEKRARAQRQRNVITEEQAREEKPRKEDRKGRENTGVDQETGWPTGPGDRVTKGEGEECLRLLRLSQRKVQTWPWD